MLALWNVPPMQPFHFIGACFGGRCRTRVVPAENEVSDGLDWDGLKADMGLAAPLSQGLPNAKEKELCRDQGAAAREIKLLQKTHCSTLRSAHRTISQHSCFGFACQEVPPGFSLLFFWHCSDVTCSVPHSLPWEISASPTSLAFAVMSLIRHDGPTSCAVYLALPSPPKTISAFYSPSETWLKLMVVGIPW